MSEDIIALRRRRGTIRASITRIKTRLRTLASKKDKSDLPNHARQMTQRLDTLSSEFKDIHYSVISLTESEEDLAREQAVLDETDDEVAQLLVEIEMLTSTPPAQHDPNSAMEGERRILLRRLSRVAKKLEDVSAVIENEELNVFVLQQYEVEIVDHKQELSEIRREALALGLEEGDEICQRECSLEDTLSLLSINLCKLASPNKDNDKPSRLHDGVKLPKLDVPSFDGDILNWRTFWEQFEVSVHSRSSLSDAEKLVYLRHSLKDGSAKNTIEGLSRSGNCYQEAIECLKGRFDRPRLIHQAHVKMIMEAPSLKDGTGKELRRLHDSVQQHLRALRTMDLEPSGEFITSLLELKLDSATMFE